MSEILNENDWIASQVPTALARCLDDLPVTRERFRWLAVKWCKLARWHIDEVCLLEFDTLVAKLADEPTPPPENYPPPRFIGFTTKDAAGLSAVRCIQYLRWANPLWACAYAALPAGDLPLDCDDPEGPTNEEFELWREQRDIHRERTLRQFCDEFRDVAGNPFRPAAFDPAWRTEAVVGLATGIDDSGAYERLPILADALEEAVCTDAQVLSHARDPGTHVRGCWLIDMILGRWSRDGVAGVACRPDT